MEIHQTKRFAKQLTALTRAGKNERNAVRRAEEILARLQRAPLDPAAENKRTRYGELRLENCRKYDLSCGFRLIGLKRDSRLIFTCIGSHDDCQRWIENNRVFLDDIDSEPVPPDRSTLQETAEEPRLPQEQDEYEEQLMARLDDKTLQEIFPAFS